MRAFFYDNDTNATGYWIDSEELEVWSEYEKLFPSNYNWDLVKNNPVSYADPDTHGTHVAGIMVAKKDGIGMHGVAYNSKVIGANMDFMWDFVNDPVYDSYKYLIDNGAAVINNSWGPSKAMGSSFSSNVSQFNYYYGDGLSPALQYATDHFVISLFAAGNDAVNRDDLYDITTGLPVPKQEVNASIISAAPMALPELLYYRDSNGDLKPFTSYPSNLNKIVSSLFITVVSVDKNNNIAYYSQKCGPAAKWCIAAPGGDYIVGGKIVSSVGYGENSTGYDAYQGTSMATPVVTSSLAVIMAAFPSLSPQEAVAILFESATNLGNADLYGHGLVNLKAAMSPLGTLSLPTTDTTTVGVAMANTKMIAPHSFSLPNLPSKLIALDKYKRAFNVPVDKMIQLTSHTKQNFANDLHLFLRQKKKKNIELSDNLSFNFSDVKGNINDDVLSGKAFSLVWHDEDNIEMGMSFTNNPMLSQNDYIYKGVNNPFTSSMTDVYTLSNKIKLTESFSVATSGSVGKNNFFDGDERNEKKNDDTIKEMQVNLIYRPTKEISFVLTNGLMNEKSSVLGLSGYGAFETKSNDTYFTGLELNMQPIDKWQLSFGYYRGYTNGRKQNSFITISDLDSESFAVNSSYDITKTLQVGFNVTSPLRVKKGRISFDFPTSRDDNQNIVYRQSSTSSLSPNAREWDWSVYAIRNIRNITLQMLGEVRLNQEHDRSAKTDYRCMFGLAWNY